MSLHKGDRVVISDTTRSVQGRITIVNGASIGLRLDSSLIIRGVGGQSLIHSLGVVRRSDGHVVDLFGGVWTLRKV